MRETEFIAQNKGKWAELEKLRSGKDKDPEKLSDLFVEVTNDLSYAKTYYPNRSIRVYLNNLAMGVHSSVYKTRRGSLRALGNLFLERIPRAYYESRWQVFLAAVIFLAAMVIGVFSTVQDPGFTGVMLGESYVDMTIENIEKGDPMAVYKQMDHMDFATYVTYNNIYVSFRVYLTGLLLMVGTVFSLLFEGVRVGSFFTMFFEYGELKEALLTVFMHGAPELSGIVLAGGAGLVLGKGLIFPGTYPRKEAFLIGARRSILMMLGLVPVFIFAGFIEGFLTRYTELPDLVRALFILITFGFVISYFFILPYLKFRGAGQQSAEEEVVPMIPEHKYDLHTLKSHAQLFSNSFAMFSSHFFRLLKTALIGALGYTLLFFLLYSEEVRSQILMHEVPMGMAEWFLAIGQAMVKVDMLYDLASYPRLYLLNSILIALAVFTGLRALATRFSYAADLWRIAAVSLLSMFILHGLFYMPVPWAFLSCLFVAPMLGLLLHHFLFRGTGLQLSLGGLISKAYFKSLWLYFVLFLTVLLFMVFSNSGLTDLFLQQVLSNIQMEEDTYAMLMDGITVLLTTAGLVLFVPIFIFASFFLFHSEVERHTASQLLQDIDNIGHRQKAYGILKEDS